MESAEARLAVIIPTLNESDSLGALLDQLGQQRNIDLQIIVADGGSGDGTATVASSRCVELSRSEPGRGRQMNQAAKLARAPFLLFLHADSRLTADDQLIRALQALEESIDALECDRVAGHFALHFRRSRSGNGLAYRYYERKSTLNRAECTNGDQGFLLSRHLFEELGGFDESLWFLEDQRLAERLRQSGRWITLPGVLETSARRFEKEGLGRRMILSALIMNFHSMELEAFFHGADCIYRNQDRTGRLQLAPIFALIHRLNREAGLRATHQRWRATGHYVLGHAWQLFFFLDVLIDRGSTGSRQPFLRLHDHIFRPLTNFAPFDYLTAALTWIWYRVSWARFAFVERHRR
ncbi:MAG: TIGR04283 family arsenosugar biosynthesis glycosyltransferase [Gammaproteobacteria bacterium]|nr:TIGR04283 family arsenosugar biosynthesis glycosyltransferase [Gammaproteobacteria bacterium]